MPAQPQRAVRKRNVTSRVRTGCANCRWRRLKCDEGKPSCANCERLSMRCEGYSKRFTFKDQTDTIRKKAKVRRSTERKKACIPQPLVSHSSSPTHGTPQDPITRKAVSDTGSGLETYSSAALDTPSIAMSRTAPVEAFIMPEVENMDYSCWDFLGTEMADCMHSMDSSMVDYSAISKESAAIWSTNCTWDISAPSQPILPKYLLTSYCFPEDILYYHHIFDANVGLIQNASIVSLFRSDLVSSHPHSFKAALALSALDLTIREGQRLAKAKQHALEHYHHAFQILYERADIQAVSSNLEHTWNAILSRLLTTLLLAKFELRRGVMLTWITHLQAAGSIVSTWHEWLQHSAAGKILWEDFSRMAMHLEIYNNGCSLQSNGVLCADAAERITKTLRGSVSPRDRLLPIIRDVINFEVEYRSQAEFWDENTWNDRANRILRNLEEWHAAIPATDLPVDNDGSLPNPLEVCGPVPIVGDRLVLSPLRFPYSADTFAAAVNYAHYLTSCLRMRTRYLPKVGRLLFATCDGAVFAICRLVAGLSPSSCLSANAYGHGIVPALMNAYYCTNQPALRKWILEWIGQLNQKREGIWDIVQATRLISLVDSEYSKRGRAEWEIIELKIVDEDRECTELNDHTPFRVFIRSRNKLGWSIEYLNVP